MDTMSQQIHTNTDRIDNLTAAVDTCSRRLSKSENSQPLSNSDTVSSTNKTNSGNTTSKKNASSTSTRQKSDLQDLPTQIRANIKNIEALAEWMGDIAISVESLKEQAGEQQEREDKVPGHDGQGIQGEHSVAADDMDDVDQDGSESQSEGSLAIDTWYPCQMYGIFGAGRLQQEQCQEQQQQVSEDEDKSKEKERDLDVKIQNYIAGLGVVFEQSDRSHTETDEGGADQDETSQLPVAGKTGSQEIEVAAIGNSRVDCSPDHCAGNKGQSDQDGLEEDVEDYVGETLQPIGVDNGGNGSWDEVAPRTKLFKKNKVYGRLFDQIASLYPQLPESEVLELADSFEIPAIMPKTIDAVWDFWFVSKEGQPSIWQLELYVKKWRKVFEKSTGAWFIFGKQKMVIEMVLETLSSFPEGSTLEARVLAAKEIVGDEITATGSIFKYLKKAHPKNKVAKA